MVNTSEFEWKDSSYFTPPFPSLYWPINNEKYSLSYLYYIPDIWWFTTSWTVILFAGFYAIAAIVVLVSYRRTFRPHYLLWFVLYIVLGCIHGLVSGTVIGFTIGVMYRAGLFAMSTWIPLCVAVAQILLNVIYTSQTFSITL